MSGNIGGQDGNQVNIKLFNGKTFNLKKLDQLVGKSTVGSVFAHFDKADENGRVDNVFSQSEVDQIKNTLMRYQASDNNISQDELNLMFGKGMLNVAGEIENFDVNKLTSLLDSLSDETPEMKDETLSQQAVKDTPPPTDENKTFTAYTVQPGDTPEVIAKKLGFTGQEAKDYAKKLREHLKSNNQLDKNGWLKVGQKIQLLGDHAETLAQNADYSEDIETLQQRYAQTEHAKKSASNNTPDVITKRAESIRKNGGQCEVVRNSDGSFSIVQTSGGDYMKNHKIAKIELKYDKDGKMISQVNTMLDGSVIEGKYENGKMNWKKIQKSKAELEDPTPNSQRTAINSVKSNAKNSAEAIRAQIEGASINENTRNLLKKEVKNQNIAYVLEAYPNLVSDIDEEWGMDITDIKQYVINPLNSRLKELGQNKHCIPNDLSEFNTAQVKAMCDEAAKIIRKTDADNGYVFTPTEGNEGKLHKPRKATQMAGYAPIQAKKAEIKEVNKQTSTSGIEQTPTQEEITHKRNEDAVKYLAMSELSYPQNIQDKLIEYRRYGFEVEVIATRDGFRLEINENAQNMERIVNAFSTNNPLPETQKEGFRSDIPMYSSTESKKSLVFDKNGNLVSQVEKFENRTRVTTYDANENPLKTDTNYNNRVNYGNIDVQRVTTDFVPTEINISRPEHLNETGTKFANSLENNKAALMKELGISNEQYNELASIAMGIAEQETHFGEAVFTTTDGKETVFSERAVGKEALDAIYYEEYEDSIAAQIIRNQILKRIPFSEFMSKEHQNALVRTVVFEVGGFVFDEVFEYGAKFTDGTKSYGVTQAKIDEFIKDSSVIKKQLETFGITCGEDIRKDPEKQAIATLIILNNKRITAESETWQNRLEINNANISNENQQITKKDLIALLWNGNSKKIDALKAGNLEIKDAPYARNVRAYSAAFFETTENETSRQRANNLGATSQGNNGQLGSVVFMPSAYTTNVKNSKQDIQTLEDALNNNNNIPQATKEKLLMAVKNGDISFGYGLTPEEAASITAKDAQLMLDKLDLLKSRLTNIVSPTLIRKEAQKIQDEFRSDYLQSRQVVVNDNDIPTSQIIPALCSGDIVNERLVDRRETVVTKYHRNGRDGSSARALARDNAAIATGMYRGFAVQEDLGVNPYDANGNYIPEQYRILAECASDVCKDMGTGGLCLTGIKASLETAGHIEKGDVVYPRNITRGIKNGDTPLKIAQSLGYSGDAAVEFAENLEKRLKAQAVLDNENNLIIGKKITLKKANGEKLRYTVKEGDTIESIVNNLGYTDEEATKYIKELKNNFEALTVFDSEGNLIPDKKIVAHQKGTPIEVARDLHLYYAANPEAFEEVKYVSLGDGTSRELNATDILNLPAGYLGVFIPGPGYENQAGHAFITNGNRQGYADEVDNLRWDDFKSAGSGSGKGEHGTFKIYRLKV